MGCVLVLTKGRGAVGRDTGSATGHVVGVKNWTVKSGRLRKGSSAFFSCHQPKAAMCRSNTATVVATNMGVGGVIWVLAMGRMALFFHSHRFISPLRSVISVRGSAS
jgi:hypothetical protein